VQAIARRWSRGRDLNPRPADFSTETMLLDSRALFLTVHHDFRRYLAGFVQKLFTINKLQRPFRYNDDHSRVLSFARVSLAFCLMVASVVLSRISVT